MLPQRFGRGGHPKRKLMCSTNPQYFSWWKFSLICSHEEFDLAGVFLVKSLCVVRKLRTSSRVELFLCQVIIPAVLERDTVINGTFSQKREIILTVFKILEVFLPEYNNHLNWLSQGWKRWTTSIKRRLFSYAVISANKCNCSVFICYMAPIKYRKKLESSFNRIF